MTNFAFIQHHFSREAIGNIFATVQGSDVKPILKRNDVALFKIKAFGSDEHLSSSYNVPGIGLDREFLL